MYLTLDDKHTSEYIAQIYSIVKQHISEHAKDSVTSNHDSKIPFGP